MKLKEAVGVLDIQEYKKARIKKLEEENATRVLDIQEYKKGEFM